MSSPESQFNKRLVYNNNVSQTRFIHIILFHLNIPLHNTSFLIGWKILNKYMLWLISHCFLNVSI